MPQPNTTRPVLLTNFGGVVINENDVQSKEVKKTNNTTRFIVNFNDGTKIEYPKQAKQNKSTIFIEHHYPGQYEEYPTYTNLAYAKITGSKNYDRLKLNGCKNCFVDVSNDNGLDYVELRDSNNRKSQNNQVKMDKRDGTYLKNNEAAWGKGTLDESAYYQQ